MKVRWGILGVAAIAVNKVIPAMQRVSEAEIVAIASRDPGICRRTTGAFTSVWARPARPRN